jgi:DNA-binding NtrC family response regulator
MQEVQQAVEKVSGASVPVLLQGERGTGKEVIGREIHRRSPWRTGPFTRMDSSVTASPANNQESHPSAAHVSLGWALPARALSAFPGTLFIEEVAELDATLQARLLELFQDRDVHQLNDRQYSVAVPRIICATRRNLEKDVAAGNFRLDLFYRINIVTIQLPPLRDRKEDIPDLISHFLELSCLHRNRDCRHITGDLLQTLCEYDWPGNIRELENCVNTYVTLDGNAAMVEALLAKRSPMGRWRNAERSKHSMPLSAYKRLIVEEAERDMILRVLSENRWNRKETAKALQISYQTLLHKLKQTGLNKRRQPQPGVVGKQIPEGGLL